MKTYPSFVYFFKEPPGKGPSQYTHDEGFANMFNITYTYRKDSAIPFLYGKVVEKGHTRHKDLQDKSFPVWKSAPKKVSSAILNHDISYKTKDILWMVSHCETDSRREDYVKKLQENLPTLKIDILGKCGKDELPNSNVDGERLGNHSFSFFNTLL